MAQTDVTSQYITNADFSEGSPLTSTYLYGYGTDGTPYGFQEIPGWISVITATNNNYGYAGGTFAYGSSTHLKGNDKGAPAKGPDGNEGNALGFFAVWGAGGYYYQEVTFAAGKYKLTFPIYCASGTQANTSFTGFFPTSGTNRTVAINTTVDEWATQTVEFTLTAETSGQIRIGYQSTGSGSAANPMLFFDGVKIEFTAQVVKTVLETAINAATTANASLNNSDLAAAITTAQAVYDNADATQDEVNAAAATLNVAVELAMSDAGEVSFLIPNLGFESCTETTTNAAAGSSAAPLNIAGDWTQVSSAAWSSSAVVSYGGTGQVNGVSAPPADNAGNSGKTLGVSVGWGGSVTYKSASATLPAGVYTLKVNAYNAFADATQFTSKFGFVPTTGNATMSSKTSFKANEWETDQVTFTLNEPTEGYIQVGGQAISGGSGSNAKVFFDNITIGYKSFLAGAKEAWDEAKAAAVAAVADEAYENITGEELTALNAEIAKAEPTTLEGYNTATEALTTATSTFTAAKADYDAFATAKAAETPELAYASEAKKTALTEAKAATATSSEDAATKTAAITTALRAYYESHALAEGVEGAVNMTSAITNANNPTNNDGWTWTGSKNNPASNEPWTDADGTNTHSYFDGGNWGANSWTTTMEQTISIPAGKYLLTAKGRAAVNVTFTMAAGETTVDMPHVSSVGNVFDRGWGDASVEFETDGSDVTIKVTASSETVHEWFSVSDFRLVRLELYTEMATAEDYAALDAAIEAAEGKALGFDEGEYAPYKNVEVIKAIATAKALDKSLENAKADVQALTETLTKGWVANTEEVDAIFDGQFATTEPLSETGKVVLPGWTKVDGIRLLVKDETVDPGLAYTEGKAAVFSWGGTTLTYGEQDGYTLPMNKNELYELTLKVSGWRDGDMPTWVTLKLDSDEKTYDPTKNGVAAINTTEGNPFVTLKAYLTPTADNSKLTIYGNKHFTIADLSMKKAVAVPVTIDETAAYTPAETFANVTLKRNFNANALNTFVVPFDILDQTIVNTFGTGVEIYEYSENSDDANNVTVNFNKMETPVIKANTPVLIKPTNEELDGQIYFNAVMIKTNDAKVEGKNFDFIGTYAPMTVAEGDYFISGNKLYKSAGATNVKGTRAYLKAKKTTSTGGEVKLYIDGLETAISEINGDAAEQGAIYNLAGQRVEKAQKGIYIVNGKKVLVK